MKEIQKIKVIKKTKNRMELNIMNVWKWEDKDVKFEDEMDLSRG